MICGFPCRRRVVFLCGELNMQSASSSSGSKGSLGPKMAIKWHDSLSSNILRGEGWDAHIDGVMVFCTKSGKHELRVAGT